MKAIIVIGMPNADDHHIGLSDRFTARAAMIGSSLLKKLGFHKGDIFTFMPDGSPGSARSILHELKRIISHDPFGDICLFYVGHGWKKGLGVCGTRRRETIRYWDLQRAFSTHYGNLIFVNYCCFAGAAVSALSKRAGDWLLISAMPSGKSGCSCNFIRFVLDFWERGKFFDPHAASGYELYLPPIFGNENLQRLIFAKADKAREVRHDAKA
ncbi:hypothetical protein KGO95_01080 [Patescibacteria group bacterium]|nr:hypothetical protein [Patescibacteria group bacterium]